MYLEQALVLDESQPIKKNNKIRIQITGSRSGTANSDRDPQEHDKKNSTKYSKSILYWLPDSIQRCLSPLARFLSGLGETLEWIFK